VARGWESKSVEAQQADAADQSAKSHHKMTREEATLVRRKETLQLARQRVLRQLESTPSPRHRKMLQDSLADLDEKLRRLES